MLTYALLHADVSHRKIAGAPCLQTGEIQGRVLLQPARQGGEFQNSSSRRSGAYHAVAHQVSGAHQLGATHAGAQGLPRPR